jgi:pimeloyl-ACP methyl ester carboxylesterase
VLSVVDRISHGVLRALGAKSLRISTGAGQVHGYEIEGRGEGCFALIHGMGTTATSYTPVVRRLKARARRVVLLDLPGHGRSDDLPGGLDPQSLATGVREGLDAMLGPRGKHVVLGTSLGGAAALGYALERPEHVRALVLASPAGAPLTEDDLVELRARFDLRTRADARRFFQELLHAPPFYLRMMERGLVTQLSRPVVQRFLASLDDAEFFSEERVGKLAVPATVLWGKSDRILPRSGLAFYRRALPAGSVFEELEGIGHSPHLERPDLVADRLLEAYVRSA